MLEITRIDHISMAVPELEQAAALFEQLFGFRRVSEWVQEREVNRGATFKVPGSSGVDWELLAPSGGDSQLWRFLDSPNGPGLHHVALQVPDVRAAVEELRRLGIEPWGQPSAASGDGWREVHIHPRRGGNGFLFQLYSADADAPWRHADPPPEAGDAEHTLGVVAISHLSHAHPDREQLSRWYESVLGMRTCYRSPDTEQGDDENGFSTQVLETPTAQMRWEILQPSGEHSFVQRFLDARGPTMHHVAFEVADWERALAACDHHGVATFGAREGESDGARWCEAFVHPRDAGGLLAQLFWQERPGVWI